MTHHARHDYGAGLHFACRSQSQKFDAMPKLKLSVGEEEDHVKRKERKTE
jgi:hypothetical protein